MTVTIEQLKGRMLDADSHLQLPPARLVPALGKAFGSIMLDRWGLGGATEAELEAKTPQPVEPDAESVWTSKQFGAPGAFHADMRLKVLDKMGVVRQLLFPMAVPAAMMLSRLPGAAEVARHHNDYVLDWASGSGDRLKPAVVLNMDDVDAALAEARRVIDRGARAVNIGCGRPPAGRSPADPAWEPLWSMLEEAGVPALLHIGGEYGFADQAWAATDELKGQKSGNPFDGEEVGPLMLAMMPFGPQAFLGAMILGGVLERHPGLHMGAIEMTAQWVGPFAEMLDQRMNLFKRLSKVLGMRPSEYLTRQVRVTPFWWEPVGRYIERYGLENVYVFSTDFPHMEGGNAPIQHFHASLEGHPDAVYEKFFVTNANLIV